MILWTGKVITEENPWRWEVEVTRQCVALQKCIHTEDGDWYPIGHYYSVGIQRLPIFGYYSGYYDGDHKAIHLGWFYITWGG